MSSPVPVLRRPFPTSKLQRPTRRPRKRPQTFTGSTRPPRPRRHVTGRAFRSAPCTHHARHVCAPSRQAWWLHSDNSERLAGHRRHPPQLQSSRKVGVCRDLWTRRHERDQTRAFLWVSSRAGGRWRTPRFPPERKAAGSISPGARHPRNRCKESPRKKQRSRWSNHPVPEAGRQTVSGVAMSAASSRIPVSTVTSLHSWSSASATYEPS